jgi:chromosome segregation ATPase
MRMLQMERERVELEAERNGWKTRAERAEERVKELLGEIDGWKGQAEERSEEREAQFDVKRENLKLKVEKDQVYSELEKYKKKLEKLKQEILFLKDDKTKCEEELRRVSKERADDREASLKL